MKVRIGETVPIRETEEETKDEIQDEIGLDHFQ